MEGERRRVLKGGRGEGVRASDASLFSSAVLEEARQHFSLFWTARTAGLDNHAPAKLDSGIKTKRFASRRKKINDQARSERVALDSFQTVAISRSLHRSGT